MASAARTTRKTLPALINGDHMSQKEFHRRYKRMPREFRAELIGGIVFVPSPLKLNHGDHHLLLGSLFMAYRGNTPGVQTGDNVTVILGSEGEPQPDLYLRIRPEFGGQSQTTKDDYIQGAPELIAEIASSSRAIDLNRKKKDYTRYGVLEYLVLSLEEDKLYWFNLREDKELFPGSDQVCRTFTFPGLWIHAPSLLADDYQGLMKHLEKGLASPEYAVFVRELKKKAKVNGN